MKIESRDLWLAKITSNITQDELELVKELKSQGREKEIQKAIKKLKNTKQTSIPKQLAYVTGELIEQYIHDMKIVQQFAMLNHKAIMDEIIKGVGLHVEEQSTTIHNYIDTDNMILRVLFNCKLIKIWCVQ